MFNSAVMFFVNGLFSILSPEKIKGFIDAGVEALAKHCDQTDTQIDDDLIMPLLDLVKAQLAGNEADINVSELLEDIFEALGKYTTLFLDAGLNWVEGAFKEGSTADEIAEQACFLIRNVLRIPDSMDN